MMRVKSITLASVLLATTIVMPDVIGALAAAQTAPDLIVAEVYSPINDKGWIKVRVKNQGGASSAACYLAVKITPQAGQMKVYSPKVPPLKAGQDIVLDVKASGFQLSLADFEVIVDRSDTVKESDETNNTLKGNFGGKP